MRALVAESNVVTRVTLTRILERAGFSVEELQDELAAVSLLYQPDPPELALLAIDTLLVDFELICDAMRAAKPDIFIVALVPDSRRNELLRVLKNGADDFVIKPVTIQEADARIFVLHKTLAARGLVAPPVEEVRERTLFEGLPDELPAALAEAAGQSAEPSAGALAATDAAPPPGGEPSAPPAVPDAVPEPVPAEPVPAEPTLLERLEALPFTDAFEMVLNQLGMGPVQQTDPGATSVLPFYTGWASLIAREGTEAAWINLRLDLERSAAARLYHVVMKRPTLDEEALLKLLRDIMGLVQDSVQRALLHHDRMRVFIPILPSAVSTDRFPSLTTLVGKGGRQRMGALSMARDVRVKVAYTMEPITPAKRSLGSLRRLDILASPVQTKGDQLMILRDGILLSDAYINKIRGFMQSHNLEREVSIFRPPSGITVFLYNLTAEEE